MISWGRFLVMKGVHSNIVQGIEIINALGLPKEQQNERTALCLLALINVGSKNSWQDAQSRLIGITPIMNFCEKEYNRKYAPNTRETFRRQSMHQFVNAGVALYNPDDPFRAVNSPKAVYQIEEATLNLIKKFNTAEWEASLAAYLSTRQTLITKYAKEREQNKIPVKLVRERQIQLTPGKHSELIRDIIEDFGARFVPGGHLLYAGDTGEKLGLYDQKGLKDLGIVIDTHGKMPDVVMYYPEKKWLILIEAVTSHGPVDGKRHAELEELFKSATVGIVYVTAFPDRALMAKYVGEIVWETEVWVADAPSHLIHFNGVRFLGPY